jgi:hypothetical protein
MAAKTPGNGARRTKKATSVQQTVTPVTLEASKNVASASVEEEIRRRAYELYLQRGGTSGNESDDWLVAEREVRSRQAAAGSSA